MDDKSCLKLDFSQLDNRFIDKSCLVLSAERPTFIFGKNGTGKTTITDAIEKQFSVSHKVCVFKDFDGVVDENKRLNAVTLGIENVDIQRQLILLEKEIENAKGEIQEPADGKNNLWTRLNDAKNKYETQKKQIDNFCTNSAREITNLLGLGRVYKINNFKEDISLNPHILSSEEVKEKESILTGKLKLDVKNIFFPMPEFDLLLEKANKLISSIVSPVTILKELADSEAKQGFARHGMSLHKPGDLCAFCGNELSERRWNKLNNYFNDEVDKLEKDISGAIETLSQIINDVNNLNSLDERLFYEKFTENVKIVNGLIASEKLNIQDFLRTVKDALITKKGSVFKEHKKIDLALPDGFYRIKEKADNLVKLNNDFSKNIDKAKVDAKNALRLHEVRKKMDAFGYDKRYQELIALESKYKEAERNLNDKKDWIENDLESKKRELLSKTKNEKRIANIINKLLSSVGVKSFSLELINDNENHQKGQYLIRGMDGKIRDVSKLSKGEKNIIGFLYFVLRLPSINDTRTKIIVLDDPMTSNDDTMQYLMISQIQKLYKESRGKNIFILLTHNCFFYLNVRDTEKQKKDDLGFYERYDNYHLLSDGLSTTIKKINKGVEDFRTNYEMLWEELLFLYEKDKPNLMISCCRKICETYIRFNNISNFYKNNPAAKKLFNVNLHAIDDLDNEQNAHTRESIKNILKTIFIDNGAESHFNFHWGDNDK